MQYRCHLTRFCFSLQEAAYRRCAQAVYPALFALYPTYEKRHKIRAMQYSNGVRVIPLWISYAMFDFIFVVVVSVACTIIVAAEAPSFFSVGYLFPVLSLYGLSATLLSYIVSMVASSQLAAFAVVAGGQAIMVLLYLLAFTLVEFFASYSTIQIGVDAVTFCLGLIFPIGNVIRALLVGFNVCAVSCRNGEHISYGGSIFAHGGPILYLCIQAVFLVGLLLWLERGHLSPLAGRWLVRDGNIEVASSTRSEVVEEKERASASESDSVRVLGVTKQFGTTVAVENATFGIQKGEIFVTLGPNGAGKSTLFDMIRGNLQPSYGEILLHGHNIVSQRQQTEGFLGTCPQFDALDHMTTREHLRFYARTKGVAEMEQDVNLILDNLGLKEYEDRLASKLSGGNQRKLSLAIALLGNPLVLLLDEPSTSLDAVSKRTMWKTIMQVTTGRSLFLTTHSMEEANVIATRVAILSTRLLSIGTPKFLRQMYGNLYHVHIMLKSAPASTSEEIQDVEQWITRAFEGARLDRFGNYHGQIRFSIPATHDSQINSEPLNERGKTSGEITAIVSEVRSRETKFGSSVARTLFTTLENNKEAKGILHYSIAPTTLEEVFMNVLDEDSIDQGRKLR